MTTIEEGLASGGVGYLLMGAVCFLLGVCVTLLLLRLRSGAKRRHRDDDDEL